MISATELFNVLGANGIDVGRTQVNVADSTFACPTKEYITYEFATFFRNKCLEMGLGTWENTNDCDNFAYQYYVMAQWAHYATKKSMAEGLSVGVMYFMSGARAEDGSGGGHAINLAIVGKPGQHELIFLEPQFAGVRRSCEIPLSYFEKESIWFINF